MKMFKNYIIAGLMLLAGSRLTAAAAPTETCIQTKVNFPGSGWYVSGDISVINTCNQDVNLSNHTFNITSQDATGKAVNLGSFNKWVNNATYDFVFTGSGAQQTGTITSSDGHPVLKAGQTIVFSGGVNLSQSGSFDNDIANGKVVTPPAKPSIIPATPTTPSKKVKRPKKKKRKKHKKVIPATPLTPAKPVKPAVNPTPAPTGKTTTDMKCLSCEMELAGSSYYMNMKIILSNTCNDTLNVSSLPIQFQSQDTNNKPVNIPSLVNYQDTTNNLSFTNNNGIQTAVLKQPLSIKAQSKITFGGGFNLANVLYDTKKVSESFMVNGVKQKVTVGKVKAPTAQPSSSSSSGQVDLSKLASPNGCISAEIGFFTVLGNDKPTGGVIITNTCDKAITLKDQTFTVNSDTPLRNKTVFDQSAYGHQGQFRNWYVNGHPYDLIFTGTGTTQTGKVVAVKSNGAFATPYLNPGQSVTFAGELATEGFNNNQAESSFSLNGQRVPTKIVNLNPKHIEFQKRLPFVHKGPSPQGGIHFHLIFPPSDPANGGTKETLPLTDNYVDLIISNLVAGSMLTHITRKHLPGIKFDRDYMTGTLFAQLLQENINTIAYKSDPNYEFLTPIQSMLTLLASGQGGPYQINDYSKQLAHGLGMINYNVMQQGLGYPVEMQQKISSPVAGTQTALAGPDSLNDKYFGPLAAAYFQFNDIPRFTAIESAKAGFAKCVAAASQPGAIDDKNNIFEMVVNGAYNAGPVASITKRLIEICGNMNDPATKPFLEAAHDFNLGPDDYNKKVGITPAASGTFVLYPRQVRYYLDQLYGRKPVGADQTVVVPLHMDNVRTVFTNVIGSLGHTNKTTGKYGFIPYAAAQKAFDDAFGANNNDVLHLNVDAERGKLFDMLEKAIMNLETNLQMNFEATTDKTLLSAQ